MPECRRIAIVGGGPRGLFALDCLSAVARQTPERALAVTLFEPNSPVGAGPVYTPSQPPYLVMNFVVGMIDAWDRSYAVNTNRPTLLDWLGQAYPAEADADAYVARARVGEYLSYCFALLCADLPAHLSLQIELAFVSSIVRGAQQWQVEYRQRVAGFDDVLLVTGHQRWQQASDDRPLSAYPAQRLSAGQDTLADTVRCKGFGLTFIDAALALTVGRGGRFDAVADGRLGYRASGREPAAIQPVSRSGRPMLCKPEAGVLPMNAQRARIVDTLAAALVDMKPPIMDFQAQVWPLFCRAADAFIGAPRGQTAGWFEAWRGRAIGGDEAELLLRQSWQIATGRAAPDVAAALARVWRSAYPQLVKIISHDGLAAPAIDGFRGIAMEMERIAFGPPASNIERLLALVDAGVLDLSQLGAATQTSYYDIDATIAAPDRFDHDGPLPELIEQERLALTAFGTVAVDPSGRPYATDSAQPVQGLAIVGRVTEGSILGNDTLSRTLHPTLARWAAQVCASDARSAAQTAGPTRKFSAA